MAKRFSQALSFRRIFTMTALAGALLSIASFVVLAIQVPDFKARVPTLSELASIPFLLIAQKSMVCTKGNRADADVQSLMTQLQMYQVMNGTYPSTQQGIEALVKLPTSEPQPRRWRKLIDSVPADPWGKPYQVQNPATRSKAKVDVFSMGPDQLANTADDIGNW